MKKEVERNLQKVEQVIGKQFGDTQNPLLVSVRSGAAVSMPGMMDTVLNLGLNKQTLEGMISISDNPRVGWDSYRRFIQMFGNVVMGIESEEFEEELQELIDRFLKIYEKNTGEDFPQNPMDQLWKAIGAVFGSWNNPRAVRYRKLHHVQDLLGTAVNVQAMVFGNLGEETKVAPLAEGLPASPGAATGQVVFSAEDAETWNEKGKQVTLVRIETSPEDIGGMDASQGILTERGGMTSHAAVVARGMGKCCVAGAGDINVEYTRKRFKVGKTTIKQGEWISINGSNGKVYKGQLPTKEPKLTGPFSTLMKWADQIRKLGIRTNADTPEDASQAVSFGAEGIGLCRTEHMFFGSKRIDRMREMIVADSEEERRKALKKLLPLQRRDFESIYKVLKGKPCTIRLLDPTLHEFVPEKTKELKNWQR